METNGFQRWLKKKTESQQTNIEQDEISIEKDTLSNQHAVYHERTDSDVDSSGLQSESDQQESIALNKDKIKEARVLEDTASEEQDKAILAHVFDADFSKEEKKRQLRSLFHSEEYQVVDPLDSYNLDYASVGSLPKEIAKTLRQWHNTFGTDPETEVEVNTEVEEKIEAEALLDNQQEAQKTSELEETPQTELTNQEQEFDELLIDDEQAKPQVLTDVKEIEIDKKQ